MPFIIVNNDLTHDTYNLRTTRLSILSSNIDTYAVEIGITQAMHNWAKGAHDIWAAALATQSAEQGERHESLQTSNETDDDLIHRIVSIRGMIHTRYEHDDDKIKVYGAWKPTPRKHSDIIGYARGIVRGHEELKDSGDPNILPDSLIAAFDTFTEKAETDYDIAMKELNEARLSTQSLAKLYDTDDDKLRELYNWATIVWGRYNILLYELGFVPMKKRHGGQPDAPTGLACDVETKTFSWDETHLATSYQLAYREYIAPDPDKKLPKLDWEEAYAGDETSVVFDPGVGDFEFKVRARNKHGFGDFSEVLLVNFHNGGVLPAPTGFKFDDVKQEFSWDWLELALVYQLEISRDGGQTWTQVYQDVDTYFDASLLDAGAALARVRALDGYQEPGEWTDPLAVTFKLRTPDFLAYGQFKNEFTCGFVPGADTYLFWLSDDGGSTWYQVHDGPNNHFVHDLAFGDWKARVRVLRGAEQSDWSPTIDVAIVFKSPTGLLYNASAHKIMWDKVTGATQYQLVNESGSVNYIGPDNHYDNMPSEPQKFRVRAGDGTMQVWGEWSAWTMLG